MPIESLCLFSINLPGDFIDVCGIYACGTKPRSDLCVSYSISSRNQLAGEMLLTVLADRDYKSRQIIDQYSFTNSIRFPIMLSNDMVVEFSSV